MAKQRSKTMAVFSCHAKCDPSLIKVQQDDAGRVWVEFGEHGGFALMAEDAQFLANKISEMVQEIAKAKNLSDEEKEIAALMNIPHEEYSRHKANLVVKGVIPKKEGA